MINLHERMLPTSAGVEPATSWSPVGRRIQLSHRGRLIIALDKVHLQTEMDEYFSFLLKNVLWVLITRLTSEYSDKRIFDES